MSQVVVKHDNLYQKRLASLKQEKAVKIEEFASHWRRSDISGPDWAARAAGIAVLPVLFIWGVITAIMMAMLSAVYFLFRVAGQVMGDRKHS